MAKVPLRPDDLLHDADLTQLVAEAFPDAPRVEVDLSGYKEPTGEELILGTAAMMQAAAAEQAPKN
jgi:hypothetical protein